MKSLKLICCYELRSWRQCRNKFYKIDDALYCNGIGIWIEAIVNICLSIKKIMKLQLHRTMQNWNFWEFSDWKNVHVLQTISCEWKIFSHAKSKTRAIKCLNLRWNIFPPTTMNFIPFGARVVQNWMNGRKIIIYLMWCIDSLKFESSLRLIIMRFKFNYQLAR